MVIRSCFTRNIDVLTIFGITAILPCDRKNSGHRNIVLHKYEDIKRFSANSPAESQLFGHNAYGCEYYQVIMNGSIMHAGWYVECFGLKYFGLKDAYHKSTLLIVIVCI